MGVLEPSLQLHPLTQSARFHPVVCRKRGFGYLRARDYIGPTDDGQRFVLSGWFRNDILRRCWIGIGGLIYTALVSGSLGLLLYKLPALVSVQDWTRIAALLVVSLMGLVIGATALNGAAKVYFASRLVGRQALPDTPTLDQARPADSGRRQR